MVKINTETYFPLCRVGAISEVAANAVNSLIPAPAPAIAIPAVCLLDPNSEQLIWRITLCVPTNENVHRMCRTADYHTKANKGGSDECNVSTTDQIRK